MFGLTPYGTFTRLRQNVLDHLDRDALPTAPTYESVRLRNDLAARNRVREFLQRHRDVSQHIRSDAELRELWVLLFGEESLFLTLE